MHRLDRWGPVLEFVAPLRRLSSRGRRSAACLSHISCKMSHEWGLIFALGHAIMVEKGVEMEYYESIRRSRKAQGLTQQQLADKLQVSRQTVARWENGLNVPNLLSAQKMADLFGVDLGELMTGEGTKRPEGGPKRWEFLSPLIWFSAVCAVAALLFRLLGVYVPQSQAALDCIFLCAFPLLALWWGLKLFRTFHAVEDRYTRTLCYKTWRWGNFFFGASLCAVLLGAFWERSFVPEIEFFGIVFSGMFCYVFCDTLLKILLRKHMVAEKNPLLWCDLIFLVLSVVALTAIAVIAGISGRRTAMICFIVFWILLGLFGCGYFLFRTLFFLCKGRRDRA